MNITGQTPTMDEVNIALRDNLIPAVHGGSMGQVSDGYHTFDELYDHRVTLWIALCRVGYEYAQFSPWRSHFHSDGSNFEGWFVLGLTTDFGQATYHLPEKRWNECGFAKTLERAPEYDGHTPDDVLSIISRLCAPLYIE